MTPELTLIINGEVSESVPSTDGVADSGVVTRRISISGFDGCHQGPHGLVLQHRRRDDKVLELRGVQILVDVYYFHH